jgi:hypothetical protein
MAWTDRVSDNVSADMNTMFHNVVGATRVGSVIDNNPNKIMPNIEQKKYPQPTINTVIDSFDSRLRCYWGNIGNGLWRLIASIALATFPLWLMLPLAIAIQKSFPAIAGTLGVGMVPLLSIFFPLFMMFALIALLDIRSGITGIISIKGEHKRALKQLAQNKENGDAEFAGEALYREKTKMSLRLKLQILLGLFFLVVGGYYLAETLVVTLMVAYIASCSLYGLAKNRLGKFKKFVWVVGSVIGILLLLMFVQIYRVHGWYGFIEMWSYI